MFENALYETPYVENLYTEYLTLINRYHNLNRRSIFCRYYNIDPNASEFNTNTNSTFDRYSSGIKYNIYDYTPLYNMTPITNESSNEEDMSGQIFSANADITLYTIKNPRIEDLIVFNTRPLDGKEIFRVTNIRASINSMNSNPGIYWFENSIEYAPLVDINKINILNHYVYSLPMERYILYDDFVHFLNNVQTFNKVLKQFENNFFDNHQELFFIDIDNRKYYPKYENKILYNFLATKNNLADLFINIKRPYSVITINDSEFKCDCLNEKYSIYYHNKNYIPNIDKLDVSYKYDIFDICTLINNWIWYYNYEKYPEYCPDILDDNISLKDGILYKNDKKMNMIVNIRTLPRTKIEEFYGNI